MKDKISSNKSVITESCGNHILGNCTIGLWRTIVDIKTQQFQMYVDNMMLSLLGIDSSLTPAEVYEHWLSRIDPKDLPHLQQTMENMLATDHHHELELLWEHPEQGQVHVRVGGTAHIQDDGKTACFEGFFKIMQEVRQMRSTLRESFEHIKTIFDATPMGAALCDYSFNLIDCNPAHLKLFEIESVDDLETSLLKYCPEFQP